MIQTWLFYGYLSALINQEMDFKVIVPGQILFYNQLWVFSDSQSMNAEKKSYFLFYLLRKYGSFINYGNVIILTEWDQDKNGQMAMDYVGSPLDTVNEIQRVLEKDYESMERNVNLLLQKFSNQIGIEDIVTPENKERLREFIKNNDSTIQEIFKNGDNETKQEVRELYVLLQ